MRLVVLCGVISLAGCGGGGTTGTNYSDPPPMAEIVATPSPRTSPTPEMEAVEAEAQPVENTAAENASVEDDAPTTVNSE